MLNLLKFLIFGHVCKWEIVNWSYIMDKGEALGIAVTLQCEKCGNCKLKRLT